MTRRSILRAALAVVDRGRHALVTIVNGLGIPHGPAGLSSCRCEQMRREAEAEATRRAILAAYERLRRDPEAWESYLAELHEWSLP